MTTRADFRLAYGTAREYFRMYPWFGRDVHGRIDGGRLVDCVMYATEVDLSDEVMFAAARTMVDRYCVLTDTEYMQMRLTTARLQRA